MNNEPRRILIAEYNPALSGVIRFNLEQAGYEVTNAANGLEAWQLLNQHQFDALVTDQQMPQLTGVELCERLRADGANKHVPVILLTAKGMELDLPDLKTRLGISAALPKPFSPRELVKNLAQCLAESKPPALA